MRVFDIQEITQTENEQVLLSLQQPHMRKFIRNLAFVQAADIARASKGADQTIEDFHVQQEKARGALECLVFLDNCAEQGTEFLKQQQQNNGA